jgi:hypothetical protein
MLRSPRGIRSSITVLKKSRFGFDRLVIQNGNQPPIVVSHAELEASLGPRQPGLDGTPLGVLAAFGNGGRGFVSDEFTDALGLFMVIVAAMGVATLLATLAFVLGSFLASRRRVPDESSDRLFA